MLKKITLILLTASYSKLKNIFVINVAKFQQHSLILTSDFKQKGKKAVKLTRRHTASSTGPVTNAVK